MSDYVMADLQKQTLFAIAPSVVGIVAVIIDATFLIALSVEPFYPTIYNIAHLSNQPALIDIRN